ncbi:Nonribosomal peptide synthetase dtxS1 [Colletotrichum gloeosporioides]|uniref:Nonribosomal peptide synthetase dtxS1 n=1 Tax=Colletotrichum gloeosporioides TaxID=474922 RepID=A0A8H4FPV2_COLGL|nr:Nonribosomal peptide synthetase dtxS1 [Colletotrichum gloeosporioides]KAF3810065.1 Nonribosomal peptide synthetase dtxS1 [Colletotrichum gloeosporioides]
MLSSDGKWKLAPRLHSVKFVFDAPIPADAPAPEEFVFESPFPSGTPGIPKKFTFKSPGSTNDGQNEASDIDGLSTSSQRSVTAVTEEEITTHSNTLSQKPTCEKIQDPIELVKSPVIHVRGPSFDLSDVERPFESLVCAAWALVLSPQNATQTVRFELNSSISEPKPKSISSLDVSIEINHTSSITKFLKLVEQSMNRDSADGSAGISTRSHLRTILYLVESQDILPPFDSTKYDLALKCYVNGTELALSATFNHEVISPTSVRFLLDDFENVLWQLSSSAAEVQKLEDIQVLGPASQRHLIQLNRPLARRENVFIDDLVANQAKLHPSAEAVCAWDANLSYGQLKQYAERLGNSLTDLGVTRGSLVPIIFEKSAYSIVAILGVLRAGGAVVALDPSLPTARLEMVIEDVKASVVISSAKSQHQIPSRISGKKRMVIDKSFIEKLPLAAPTRSSPLSRDVDDALYVVFTSGSTGKPKGVVVTHTAFASSAKGFSKAIHLDSPSSRVLQYSSFSFDISMLEVFTSLMAGACLCIPSEEQRMNDLATCISSMDVNWAMLTPSVASLISPEDVPSLDVLCLVGEALPQAVADVWADHVKTINAYGPAECSALTIVSAPRVRDVKSISIGRPVNCAVWIVNENGQLAPFNAVGEIVIEGPPVARGYLGDDAKTKEVFLDDPEFLRGVVRHPGRCYRTGDLGRMNPDGSIDFLGRKDSQVKINGQRVELGEIEHQIKELLCGMQSSLETPNTPAWDVAVELLRPSGTQTTILSAFIACPQSTTQNQNSYSFLVHEIEPAWMEVKSLSAQVLIELADRLPTYMVPKTVVPCHKLPLSPSGKTDRKALRNLGNSMTLQQLMSSSSQGNPPTPRAAVVEPEPLAIEVIEDEEDSSEGQITLLSETVPASESSMLLSPISDRALNPVEVVLRKAWANVLSLPEDSITAEDDFFRLGGDSIGAIKVVAACRQLALQINVASIFKNSVLRQMALVCKTTTGDDSNTVPIKSIPFQFLNPADVAELREEVSFQCEVQPDEIEDMYPCTHMQEGLMAVNLTRPGSYTGRWIHPLPQGTNLARFKKSWEDIHAASPVLRTRFATTASAGSLQAIMKEHVQWLTSDNLETYLANDDANPMFPGDSLNRFALITDANGNVTFVWTIHHMLYDGWSLAMLCNRLNEKYHGRTVKPATDYRKFISYTQKLESWHSSDYWQRELCECPQSTFPAAPRSGHQSFARAVVRDSLIIDVDSASGVTMSTVVRAAWALMISHFSKSDDVLFGATVSGRNAPLEDIDNIEGPTIATVPVRVPISKAATVLGFLRQVQDQATTMIPFEQAGIQQIKSLNEDTKRGCEFQNLLVVQAGGGWDESGPGPLGKPIYREEFTTFPVTCEVWLQPGKVEFATHVDEDVTTRVFVAQAVETVKIIMNQLSWATSSAEADCELSRLTYDVLPAENGARARGDVVPVKISATINDLISEQSTAHPGKDAVTSTLDTLSYDSLEAMSSALAIHLRSVGVAAGEYVPLCFEKSVWTVVAMLAVMKAGAAFVPLDPAQPISRLRAIMSEIKAKVAIVSAFHSKATELGIATTVVADRSSLGVLLQSNTTEPARLSNPENPAYVIFTSGSTGTPKGVVISHSAFASGATAHGKALGISSDHRVLQFSSYTFDASLFEILTTLTHGGTVCIPTEKQRVEGILDFVKEMDVSLSLLTPSVARLLAPSSVPSLKTLILGGEAPDEPLIARWVDSGAKVFNAYGPSECSVIATVQACAIGAEARTIGYPVGCSCWVVDADDVNTLVADCEVGELLIDGPTLANGYLDDLQTSASFIDSPIWGKGTRLYKTGDLVQRTKDGYFIYHGRKDFQIKVNGQRVELGDIESHLSACRFVKRGVVIFPSSGPLAKQLVGVLDMEEDEKDDKNDDDKDNVPDRDRIRYRAKALEDIKQELSERVPSIMVPRHWVDVEKLSTGGFPLSIAGKAHRKLIESWIEEMSAPDAQAIDGPALADCATPDIRPDEVLAYELASKIFSLLPRESFHLQRSIPNRFADLLLHSSGLDSLNMMSIMHFVRSKYQMRVSIQILMDERTSIRSLAAFISDTLAANKTKSRAPAQAVLRGIDIMTLIERQETELLRWQHMSDDIPKIPARSAKLTVFLTGANGYLGTQILRRLLEREDVERVITLVRGHSIDTARKRVIEAAKRALWWTDFHGEKLEVWKGDLGMPNLGLTNGEWNILADRNSIDIIIHNGAIVNWNKSYAALEAVNVRSTVQLTALAIRNPNLKFTYISGGRQCRSADELDEDVARELSEAMGYSQSKFVAEVLVKRAAERCPPGERNIAVFRPGLIIGTPTEGVANTDDYIWRLTAASIDVGAYNCDDYSAWLHLSDATTTAEAAICTAFSPASLHKAVVHHEDGMTWGAFWSLIQNMGFSIRSMPASQWLPLLRRDIASRNEGHPLWPLAHLMEDGSMEWDVRVQEQREPPLILKVAVKRNVEFLVRAGFLSTGGVVAETTHVKRAPFSRVLSREGWGAAK